MTATVWTGEQATKDEALAPTRERWFHGKLLPIKVRYLKWAAKNGKAAKGGKPTEISHDEFAALPQGQRGQEVILEIDPKVISPTLQFTISRKTLMGGQAWNNIIQPSINEMVAAGPKSLATFADRANAGTWYVEGKLVPTGRTFEITQEDGTAKTVHEVMPQFTRMTDNADELKVWNLERFPKQKAEIPSDVVEGAKVIFARVSKGDLAKFAKTVGENEDLQPYAEELIEAAKSW